MNANYEQRQIDRVAMGSTDFAMQIEARDGGRLVTKWLNVTRGQLEAIREIMKEAQ